jgi:hypothetical protein
MNCLAFLPLNCKYKKMINRWTEEGRGADAQTDGRMDEQVD